jgi:acetoacetate decarboxylase
MLKGFSTPLSPTGASSLAPMPPWHFVSNFLVVEYWADPAAVRAVLPPGVEPGEDPGKCAVFFSDNQYASGGDKEWLDPSVSQYMECFVAVSASWEGKSAGACPYIFVDNDNSMMRGQIQGMPKQIGLIRMSRAFALESPAAPQVGPNGRFVGTLTHRDRRVVDATVTLEEQTTDAPNKMLARMINMRYFPRLTKAMQDKPAVHELVRQRVAKTAMSPIWRGKATLEINKTPWTEMGELAPVRVGAGFRYTFAMTVDDLMTVRDFTAAASTGAPIRQEA